MTTDYKALHQIVTDGLRATCEDNAAREARYVIQYATGWDAAALIARGRDVASADHIQKATAMMLRRQTGEPLSRISGVREFYGLEFALNADTLDPRADSEALIDAALAWLSARGDGPVHILDVGTGTGCLLLTLLHLWPDATGIGIDRSYQAAAQAAQNADSLGLTDRCLLLQGDWVSAIAPNARFDLILSNPPYIPRAVIPTLDVAVRVHDPILALDGGDDGLNPYRILVYAAPKLLTRTGAVLFEVGIDQAEDVAQMAVESGATQVITHPDSGGIQRVVDIRYGDK